MEIVGKGFLAQHLGRIAEAHEDYVVLAAGVSCASRTSEAEFRREAELVERVARRCRAEGRRVLFFSTAAVGMYGAAGCRGREDEPVSPQTPYGLHKHGLERSLRDSGADHLILRLSHVVGPGQPPHQLLPSLTRQVRSGRVRIHRGAARDLLGVEDLVALTGLLLGRAGSRETVNVASGVAVPVDHIVDHVEARLGLSSVREYVTVPGNHTVSVAKLRELVPEAAGLGFTPDYYRTILDRYVLPATTAA